MTNQWEKFKAGHVPGADYATIRQWSARFCHDVVIYVPDEEKILLAVRKAEPAKGLLWPFGGAQKRGIPIKKSLQALTTRECGLELDEVEAITTEGPVDHFWTASPYDFTNGVHDIGMFYSGVGRGKAVADKLHDTRWVDSEEYLSLRENMFPWVRAGMDVAVGRFFDLPIANKEPFPDFYIDGKPHNV